MIEQFKQHIKDNKLIGPYDKVLAAVSGGADSVAMLDLLVKSGFNVAVAHCNFKLRAEDSDADELFVKQICEKYNILFYSKICETKEYSEQNKVSIEMAARELRYAWFNDLAVQHGYSKIATAHHLNDSVETILLNITKKTGIRGLKGIPVVNDKIIRPLLFVSKNDILKYCEINNLSFRIDKTNNETDYQRNKIRNIIIPEFEKINPAFTKNITETSAILSQYYDFFNQYLKVFKKKCVVSNKFYLSIDTTKISEFKPVELFMFEFLRHYNFNATQVKNIIDGISNVGRQYFSDKFKIVVDRNKLVLSKINSFERNEYLIDSSDNTVTFNTDRIDEITINITRTGKIDKIDTNPKKAFLDSDKLKYPLVLRKWENGDYFFPLGMTNRKKLSDFFTDNKFNLAEKENTWILCSEKRIVWIVGYRIDNRFKVNEQTSNVTVLEIL